MYYRVKLAWLEPYVWRGMRRMKRMKWELPTWSCANMFSLDLSSTGVAAQIQLLQPTDMPCLKPHYSPRGSHRQRGVCYISTSARNRSDSLEHGHGFGFNQKRKHSVRNVIAHLRDLPFSTCSPHLHVVNENIYAWNRILLGSWYEIWNMSFPLWQKSFCTQKQLHQRDFHCERSTAVEPTDRQRTYRTSSAAKVSDVTKRMHWSLWPPLPSIARLQARSHLEKHQKHSQSLERKASRKCNLDGEAAHEEHEASACKANLST